MKSAGGKGPWRAWSSSDHPENLLGRVWSSSDHPENFLGRVWSADLLVRGLLAGDKLPQLKGAARALCGAWASSADAANTPCPQDVLPTCDIKVSHAEVKP